MSRPLPIAEGRRFGCTMCGNCCVEDGFVFFSPRELEAMAEYLDLGLAEFRDRYSVDWSSSAEQFSVEARDGRGCPLLTPDRKCSVHPVKPAQCAAWPFWDEMLDEEGEWERCKSYCPGLDAKDGRLYSREEILEIRLEQSGTIEATRPAEE